MRCAISADAKLNKEVDNTLTKKTKTVKFQKNVSTKTL